MTLREFLIMRGAYGASQGDMLRQFRKLNAGVLQSQLEWWRRGGAVQKFRVPTKTKSSSIWRATERLMLRHMDKGMWDFNIAAFESVGDTLQVWINVGDAPILLKEEFVSIRDKKRNLRITVAEWYAIESGLVDKPRYDGE